MCKLILVVLIFLNTTTQAEPINYGNVTISEVTSIYDGDSFTANIEGWPDLIGKRINIRVSGVDTPEMRGKCEQEKLLARKAKQYTVELLRSGSVITLENIHRGKYFRIVADVYIDGESLSESLIRSELGVTYYGKTKSKNWCE